MLCRRAWVSHQSPSFCSSSRSLSSLGRPGTLASLLPDVAKASKPERQPRVVALSQKALLDLSRKDWLAALSPPERPRFSLKKSRAEAPQEEEGGSAEEDLVAAFSDDRGTDLALMSSGAFVLGIDPDVSGAIAVLRGNDITTAEVFDVPSLRVIIGSQQRRRHDARAIVDLINKLHAPLGSVAYVEQSMPLPKDGKQGWWGSGFGFGIWIGTLVASGFSVVPVPPLVWKRAMELSGKTVTKDDCRACASLIFPSLASQLKRKKDHGRAEALLIAAYGQGIPAPLKEFSATSSSDNGSCQES